MGHVRICKHSEAGSVESNQEHLSSDEDLLMNKKSIRSKCVTLLKIINNDESNLKRWQLWVSY